MFCFLANLKRVFTSKTTNIRYHVTTFTFPIGSPEELLDTTVLFDVGVPTECSYILKCYTAENSNTPILDVHANFPSCSFHSSDIPNLEYSDEDGEQMDEDECDRSYEMPIESLVNEHTLSSISTRYMKEIRILSAESHFGKWTRFWAKVKL